MEACESEWEFSAAGGSMWEGAVRVLSVVNRGGGSVCV